MALNVPAAVTSNNMGNTTSITHSSEDYRKLQELLQQALKRETEALRKVKHLHELLEHHRPANRTPSEGSTQFESPDSIWDVECSQLSQDSNPQSPTPALIVSEESPNIRAKHSKSRSQPSSPIPIIGSDDVVSSHTTRIPHSRSNENLRGNGLSNGEIRLDDWPTTEQQQMTMSLPVTSHLMPLPRELKDVRKEREKPPPSTATGNGVQNTGSPTHEHAMAPRTSVPTLHQVNPAEQRTKKRSSLDHRKTNSIGRSSSIKEKDSRGHRGRSNTIGIQLPNWLKRKREQRRSVESSQSTGSIDELFVRFSQLSVTKKHEDQLAKYLDRPWSEVCVDATCSPDDRKYRDAVWDLFQSETKYLINFLQPLELVYKGFLEELHFHDILKIADVDRIFANLSELCELSSSVANDLFRLFEGRSGNRVAPNNELVLAFSMFGHKFNPVYQRFCVNFEKQRGFVRALHQLPEFQEYHRVCRSHRSVAKNDLTSLLITPLQHQCRYQLLLDKVLKYTKDHSEKALLSSTIKAFVVSLKELEANIEENKRSAELLEVQEMLYWPPVSELDTEAYKPESLSRQLSSHQQCREILATKDRQLVFKGSLKLLDSKAKPCQELNVFLFTDLLLFTTQKSAKKEELTKYCVYGHPVFLSLLEIHDPGFNSTHKYTFTLVERTHMEQRVHIYSLQASSKDEKAKWMSQLQQCQQLLRQRQEQTIVESDI